MGSSVTVTITFVTEIFVSEYFVNEEILYNFFLFVKCGPRQQMALHFSLVEDVKFSCLLCLSWLFLFL